MEAQPAVTVVRFPDQKNRKPRKSAKQLCPALHDMDYSADELEFMRAVDAYKQANSRPFPTLKEILAIVRQLGYAKQADA